MIRLTEWEFDKQFSEVFICGYVAEETHPKYGEWLCTSAVLAARCGEDGQSVIVNTGGGEDYELPVKDMSPYKAGLCCEMLQEFGIFQDFLQGAAERFRNRLMQIEELAESILMRSEIYLIARGANIRRVYWRDSSGAISSQEIDSEWGNPVVITADDGVELQVSELEGEINLFQCSRNLAAVWIQNVSKEEVIVRRHHYEEVCPEEAIIRLARVERVVFDRLEV